MTVSRWYRFEFRYTYCMATVFTELVDSRYSVSVGGIFCNMTFWMEDLPLLFACQLLDGHEEGQRLATFADP